MATTRVNIPRNLLVWLREIYEPKFKEEWHFTPTDNQLLIHAIYELKVTKTGGNIEVYYNKKRKCLMFKEK